jgi:predicted Zn-dependent protease
VKIKPVHLIVLGVILIGVIYFFGKMTSPVSKNQTADGHANSTQQAASGINLEQIIQQAKSNLSLSEQAKIDSLTDLMKKFSSNPSYIKQLKDTWEKAGSKIITAEYAKQLAEMTQKPADFAEAGNLLVDAFENAADSSLVKPLSDDAFSTLQKAIELDTNNIDNKVNLAAVLMEARNNVMEGVQILLSVTKKFPEHLKANLILAKFATISGQYDKAIARANTVIKVAPQDVNGYMILSRALMAKGEMKEARNVLLKAEQNITDNQAKTEIEKIVQQIN